LLGHLCLGRVLPFPFVLATAASPAFCVSGTRIFQRPSDRLICRSLRDVRSSIFRKLWSSFDDIPRHQGLFERLFVTGYLSCRTHRSRIAFVMSNVVSLPTDMDVDALLVEAFDFDSVGPLTKTSSWNHTILRFRGGRFRLGISTIFCAGWGSAAYPGIRRIEVRMRSLKKNIQG